MTCPVCHEEIESGSATCPKCGAQLEPVLTDAQRKGGFRVTVILYVVSLAVMAVFIAAILAWHDEQQRTLRLEQEATVEAEVPADAGNDEPLSAPCVESLSKD